MNKPPLSNPNNPIRSSKLDFLEKSWNPNVSIRADQKRLVQMSQDIKHFLVKSLNDPEETQKVIERSNRIRERSMDSFEQISSTLGFKHHEGTDKNLELKVVKVIMVREGLLMSLRHIVENANRTETLNGTNILEMLAQLREKALNYLEALCLWRQSAIEVLSGDPNIPAPPRIFVWEHQNYTIKLINDMDFLADSGVVINTLKIPPDQLRSNPLMLSNNLEDINTWMDPYERAVIDTNGVTTGTEFETRLRLRFAERILLQELESNNNNVSQQFFVTQPNDAMNPPMMMMNQGNGNYYDPNLNNFGNYGGSNNYYGNNYDPNELMIGSNALEDDYDSNEGGEGKDNYYSPTNHQQEQQQQQQLLQQQEQQQQQRRVYPFERTTSNDSNTSQDPIYHPQSRSSTMSSGYGFAYETGDNRRSYSQPLSSANGNGPDPYSSTYQYGHEFFAGNWGEESRFSAAPQNMNNPVYPNSGGDGVFDGGFPNVNANNNNNNTNNDNNYYPDNYPPSVTNNSNSNDQGSTSVRSIKSLETITEIDIKGISTIKMPPKSAVLTGSVLIILLSRENKIPIDLNWRDFVKFCKTSNVAEQMNTLDPDHVAGYKIIAVQPMLDELVEDRLISAEPDIKGTEISVSGQMALNKLITWVKQFTLNALKKQRKFGTKSPLRMSNPNFVPAPAHWATSSASPSPTNRKKPTELSPLKIERSETNAASKSSKKRKQLLLRHSKKVVVPKMQLDLDLIHTELLENVPTKHPILLVVLTSPPEDPNKKVIKSTATASTASSASVDEAGPRIVLKVYDTVTSEETLLHVNVREWSLFLDEYVEIVGEKAREVFQPGDVQWWAANGSKVISVQMRSSGKIKASISKRLLTETIGHLLAVDHQQQHPHGRSSPLPPVEPPKKEKKEKDQSRSSHHVAANNTKSKKPENKDPAPAVQPTPSSAQDRVRLQTKSPAALTRRSTSISPENDHDKSNNNKTNSLGGVEKRQSMPNVKIHNYSVLNKTSKESSFNLNEGNSTPSTKNNAPFTGSPAPAPAPTPAAAVAPAASKNVQSPGTQPRRVPSSKSDDEIISAGKKVQNQNAKQTPVQSVAAKSLSPVAVKSVAPPSQANPVHTPAASVVAPEISVISNHYEEDFSFEEKKPTLTIPGKNSFSEQLQQKSEYSLEEYDEQKQLKEYLVDQSEASPQPHSKQREPLPPSNNNSFTAGGSFSKTPSETLHYSVEASFYSDGDNQSEDPFKSFFENIDQKKETLSSKTTHFQEEFPPPVSNSIGPTEVNSSKRLPVQTSQSASVIDEVNQIDEFPSYASSSIKQQPSIAGAPLSVDYQQSSVIEDNESERQIEEFPSYASTSIKQQPSIPHATAAAATSSLDNQQSSIIEENESQRQLEEFPSYASTSIKQQPSTAASNPYAEEDFENNHSSVVEEDIERSASVQSKTGPGRGIEATQDLNQTSQSIASENNQYEYDGFESMNNSLSKSQVIPAPSHSAKETTLAPPTISPATVKDKEQQNEQEKEENPSYYSEFDQDEEDLYNLED